MKTHIALIALFFSLLNCSFGAGDEVNLLEKYHGDVVMPDDLLEAYKDLMEAIASSDWEAVKKLCLPHSVRISKEKREKKVREYGQDINQDFVENGFSPQVLTLRKDSDDSYLVRTGSSYLYFVQTKSAEWKLYRYGDKPIR